mgnify:CR=1 FL=1|tara:strand:- start:351 stop:521 length:171 start_codon:yes stop_codon:yes gene_type:complete
MDKNSYLQFLRLRPFSACGEDDTTTEAAAKFEQSGVIMASIAPIWWSVNYTGNINS